MRKWIFGIVLIIAIVIGYNYVFKAHRDIATETAHSVMESQELADEFQINPAASESKYLDKTIQVSGRVSEVTASSITLDDKVFCVFSNVLKSDITPNQTIKIKGRFIGYDDLFEQIKLDQCHIIN